MNSLVCDQVTKAFSDGGHEVLKGVSLNVSCGEIVALTGESGSGKTTLLNLIGLLDQPSSGTISLFGQPTSETSGTSLRLLRAQTIGFVFQDASLDSRRTALENVTLTLRYSGMPRADREQAARQALEQTNVAHLADQSASLMSGGERQRVAIARAIAHQPQLLLCDEPTGALDRANTDNICSLLVSIARSGTAVLMVTHDARVAELCDRKVELVEGQLL